MEIRPITSQTSLSSSYRTSAASSKGSLNELMAQVGQMQLQVPDAAKSPIMQALADAQAVLQSGDEEAIKEQIERFQKMLKMLQDLMMLQASINLLGNPDEENEEEDTTASALLADTRYVYQKAMLDNSVQKLMEYVSGPLGYDQQVKNLVAGDVTDSLRNMLGL